MPMHNQGFTKLTEECGELVQIAAKAAAILAVNPQATVHWDGKPIHARLADEIGDVIAACKFVMAKHNLDQHLILDRARMKLELFNEWDKQP